LCFVLFCPLSFFLSLSLSLSLSLRYHFDGSSHEFFEGWYFKVSILEVKQSFAWMYVSKNLGTATSSSKREGGACGPSSVAQIMGANDEYLFQDQPFVKSLWYGGIKIF
jgi:tocopherol cyclase